MSDNNNNNIKNLNLGAEPEYEYSNNEYEVNNNNTNKKPKKTNAEKTIVDFIQEGNFAKVREIFETKHNLARGGIPPPKGLVITATKAALQNSSKDALNILEYLIDKSQPVTDPVNPEFGPLNYVAMVNTPRAKEVLDLLIRKGIKSTQGQLPPIFTTIASHNKIIFDALLEALSALAINDPDLRGVPVLYRAVEANWPYAVERLLKRDIDLTYVNRIGDNTFITVVKMEPSKEKDAILQAFLDSKKVKFDFHNPYGRNALMSVALIGDVATFKKLMANPEARATLFANYGRGTILSEVYKQIQDLKSPGYTGLTPAQVAERVKNLKEILRILIENGLKFESIVINGYSPLLLAIENHDMEEIRMLLKLGANLGTEHTERGFNPVTLAIRKGYMDVLKLLLEQGKLREVAPELLGYPDGASQTPIQVALGKGYVDILFFLLEQGVLLVKNNTLLVEAIRLGETEEGTMHVVDSLIKNLRVDPNEADASGFTPLMMASNRGFAEIVKFLLEAGVDVQATKQANDPFSPNAYDMAKSMEIRLLLAPFMETDQVLFRGFVKQDFFRLQTMFSTEISTDMDPISFVICPFCFLPLSKSAGCMYVFEHNCLKTSYTEKQIVHEKLYHTYKDDKSNISVCHHCNRAGFSYHYIGREGQQLVHHKHIVLNSPNPFIKPREEKRKFAANYYDTHGCGNEGGGSLPEKITRIQVLLNFMCFMNKHFVGKIANIRAHLLCREMFWEAALYDYLGKVPFSTEIPDPKIKDVVEEFKDKSNKEIVDGILRNKQFVVLFEPPTDLLPLPEGVVNRDESTRVYPNVRRYKTNARDLAPIQEGVDTTKNGGKDICWYYANLEVFDGVTGHDDGRPLYRFKHRQPGRVDIYDHGAKKPKELICANCLENFIIDTAIGGVKLDVKGNPLETNAEGKPVPTIRKPEDKLIQCFHVEKCKGHFHPSELRGIVRDEIYQAYRQYYNRNPVLLGGSREENKEDYPPLIGDPIVVEQDTCPVPFKGGRRKRRVTRKGKKSKSKTRKSKRYTKTRKH